MKKFFLNSVAWVTFFSLIKFILNLKIASLLLPSDYGMILMPLIFFSFLDLLLEGGFHAGIIKFNPPHSDIKIILKSKLKLGLVIAPILAFFQLLAFSYLFPHIPSFVIFAFMMISIIKLSNYFFEAKLIADGSYVKTETLNFLVTVSIYLAFIFIIPKFQIAGYYYLCCIYILLYGFYGTLLYIFYRQMASSKDQNSSHTQLLEFAYSRIQSSFIFALSGRLDEFAAAILFSPSMLGIYSRVKELGVMIGTFSSKIISRPWYYIACNLDIKPVRATFIAANIFILAMAFLFFGILQFLMSIIIDFLGPNWALLSEYSIFMVLIFLSYFLSEFSLYTLLALGKERHVLIADRVIVSIRIICYLLLFCFINFSELKISIDLMLYLEIILRVLNIFFQYLIFFMARREVQSSS